MDTQSSSTACEVSRRFLDLSRVRGGSVTVMPGLLDIERQLALSVLFEDSGVLYAEFLQTWSNELIHTRAWLLLISQCPCEGCISMRVGDDLPSEITFSDLGEG